METNLETKFKKQSKPFLKELKAAEKKYEKFLKSFVKSEITGNKDFNFYLESQLDLSKYCCREWDQDALLESFVKPYDLLEMLIDNQIFSLMCDADLPPEDGGPLPFALAKERAKL